MLAYRPDTQRILSFVPDLVAYELASQMLRSTVEVRPEVLELIKANTARNSRY